jgi:hypothetical protein
MSSTSSPNLSSSTASTINFPLGFTLYSSIAALLVFWFLLYATQSLAIIVQTILKWKLGRDRKITLGSINIAFLGGKIFLHDLVYTDKDIALQILSISIGFRWWLRHVRQPKHSEHPLGIKENMINKKLFENLPFRLSVHIVGLKVVFCCASKKYDQLKQVLEERANKANKDINDNSFIEIFDQMIEAKLNRSRKDEHEGKGDIQNSKMPLFYRISPVTKLIVQDLIIEAGNTSIEERIKLKVKFGEGQHSLENGKNITSLNIRDSEISLEKNPDFGNLGSIVGISARVDAKGSQVMDHIDDSADDDIFLDALLSFKEFVNDHVLTNFTSGFSDNHSEGAHKKAELQRNERSSAYRIFRSKSWSSSKQYENFTENTHAFGSNNGETLDRSQSLVLMCSKLQLQYEFDYSWRVSADDGMNDGPKQTLFVNFQSRVEIVYGPWADSYRAKLQRYFFPYFYSHYDLYKLVPGNVWDILSFHISISFEDSFRIQIPFRRSFTLEDEKGAIDENERLSCLEIESAPKSKIEVSIPMYITSERGSSMTVNAEINSCRVIPMDSTELFSGHPIIESSSKLFLSMDFQYPLKWNAQQLWQYSLRGNAVKIFFVKDQIRFLTDLGSDWSSYSIYNMDLNFFVPFTYDLKIHLEDMEWAFYVAENNIVKDSLIFSEPNQIPTINALSPVFNFDIQIPYINFRSPCFESQFEASFRHINFELSLPDNHPWAELHKGKFSRQFLYAKELNFIGNYTYYYKQQPENSDFFDLNIDVSYST